MEYEKEKHFKKQPKKPWVLEITIMWPDKSPLEGFSVWKYRYATEKAAQQAAPELLKFTKKYNIPTTYKIYKK